MINIDCHKKYLETNPKEIMITPPLDSRGVIFRDLKKITLVDPRLDLNKFKPFFDKTFLIEQQIKKEN